MLTEAAAQGHVEAQANLGAMYCFGEGVAKDDARAFELYRQAALQGHARSQFNLGLSYRHGMGCEQSHKRAVEWYAKAVEQGYAPAQHALGVAYHEGLGVPQSNERAVELYKLGEAQGHANSYTSLGACYDNGWGVDMSFAEARRLYELAVARGAAQYAADNLQDLNGDIQQHCPLLGQRVVLSGLNTATLNGARGTAVDLSFSERDPGTGGWFAASGRCTVRLDGPEGRLVKVRSANVAKAD